MIKDELKPIDVSKYKVTETGQVLKMTEYELAKKADTNHALVSQLAELAELKEDLRNKKLAIQNRNGRIKELEKENAELKDDNKVMADNLTKAKEIIKELLSSCFGYNSKTVNYEVKANAEDFLNSEV